MQSAETTETSPAKLDHQDFLILDEADEKQIAEIDQKMKEALVYELKGQKELSYIGLKHLTLLMSQKGQALQVQDDEVHKEGVGEAVIWYAKMKVKNIKTGHETVGFSQQPAFMEMKEGGSKPDAFARTKALSKAERNAWRKQIPELQIKTFIDVILKKNPKGMQKINNSIDLCTCDPVRERKAGETTRPDGLLECRTCAKPISKLATDAILSRRKQTSK